MTFARFASPPLLAAALLSGCTNSDDSAVPTPIEIDTWDPGHGGGAALVAYDDGAGWVAAAEIRPGVFGFTPSGSDDDDATIAFAVVCDDQPGDREVTLYYFAAGTVPAEHAHPCRAPVMPAGTVAVRPAEAFVAVGDRGYSWDPLTPSAERAIEARIGKADLVAMSDERVSIVRGVTMPLTAPLTLDAHLGGSALERIQVPVPALQSGERSHMSYGIRTSGGTTVATTVVDGAVAAVPSSALQPGEEHRLSVEVSTPSSFRGVRASGWALGGLVDNLGLPQPITAGAQDDRRFGVWWNEVPRGEVVVSLVQPVGDTSRFWTTHLDLDYQDAVVAQGHNWEAPDLSAVAGWDPAFSLDRSLLAATTWVVASRVTSTVRANTVVHESGAIGTFSAE